MNILHIYKDYYPVLGGIENHVRLLAEGQACRGHDVTVLVTNTARRTVVEERNGVRVIKAGRLANVASAPLSLSFPWHLMRMRPDIAHLQFPYPPAEVANWLMGRAKRTVISYQSDVVRQRSWLRFYRPIMLRVLGAADRLIASSSNYLSSSPYLSELVDRTTIIPLGIELDRFSSVDEEAVAEARGRYGESPILFVGRLRYYKGLQYLIRAMDRIPARLLVVGTGPMEAEWRALADGLGLQDKVLFLGDVPDGELPALYHLASIFVLPASHRSEAYGLVQIEAMASGTPVICTELGTGTSWVNLDGETGLAVPPRDSTALAAATNRLLDDDELREAMGARAAARARSEFSSEVMIDRMLSLYAELLGI
jgi:glycosyltransferase involved in cell wall biosynthesis